MAFKKDIKETEADILSYLYEVNGNHPKTGLNLRCSKSIAMKFNRDEGNTSRILTSMAEKGWLTREDNHGTVLYFVREQQAPNKHLVGEVRENYHNQKLLQQKARIEQSTLAGEK